MGHIFRELKEIPIPAEAVVNKATGQVSVYYRMDGKRRRTVIGAATSLSTMQPNLNYRHKYPELWRKYYGDQEELQAPQISAGLYATSLGIGWESGLYEDLQEAFGPEYANAVMDFALFSMRHRSSAAQHFEEDMSNQMLYSRQVWSDSYFSELFNTKLTESRIHQFRLRWLQRCAAKVKSVWLCIDGTNNDCAATKCDLAELGHAKSKNITEIVSYIWAVDAHSGRPVTWQVNPGGMPDCKAINEIVNLLATSKIKVEGVIVDRGFASQEVLDLLNEKRMKYIVMLKNDCHAHRQLMVNLAQTIRWDMKHLVSPTPVFGEVGMEKVFANSEKPSCIGLFFAGVSAACRNQRSISKIWTAAEDVRTKIAEEEEKPQKITIPADVAPYLELVTDDKGNVEDVRFNLEACQTLIDKAGYYSIASSDPRSAKEIHDLYQLRDVSEKQYSILKTQLDGDVTRTHTTAGIRSRLAVGFVAGIVRTELEIVCKSLELDTNDLIRKLDRAYFSLMPSGQYCAIHNLSDKLKKVMGLFGIGSQHFEKLAAEYNDRNSPMQSPVKRLPVLDEIPWSGKGRKPGSKNKKTLEREAMARAAGEQPKEKRKAGRPKGSKNKATLEREKNQPAQAAEKRKPGRPKGSKNKKTLEREKREEAARLKAMGIKRSPGRPKGSKNKLTLEREQKKAEAVSQNLETGRPNESTNKPATSKNPPPTYTSEESKSDHLRGESEVEPNQIFMPQT